MQNTAIYLRLSRDDAGVRSESESIASQRMLLYQYAAAHGLTVCAEYADDGISGLRRDRPGLCAMLSAIENGLIGTVLVKDLSRLSRDYLYTGQLIEQYLPQHGVRLIAVGDCVDTALSSASNDFSPIRALLNDWYARDISRKVRAALRARRAAGLCTLASVPFGYRKSGGTLAVCEPEAEVIRAVYRRYLSGESCTAIAGALNAQCIPSPRRGRWQDSTVRRLLRNPVYCGELLLGTTEKQSYKSAKTRLLTADAAVRFPVPAIVAEEDFAGAQAVMQRRAHRSRPRHWLSGRAFCALCGSRMTVSGTELRLTCAGRRRGSGCVNPSCGAQALLGDVQQALADAGFVSSPALLSAAVQSLRVGPECVSVQLKYARPVQ